MNLRLDLCSHEAAKYAVEHWHYSKVLPVCNFKIGVWENNKFIGAIIYGMGGGNSTNGKQYGLAERFEVAELTRVALSRHVNPVSRMISVSIKILKRHNPKLKLLISFADESGQRHLGKIYQAGNWIYTGVFDGDGGFIIHGKTMHNRSVYSKGWVQNLEWLRKHVDPNCQRGATRKHRYLYPLDEETRQKVLKFKKPYPKIIAAEVNEVTSGDQPEKGGATPTQPLHFNA